MTDFHRSFDHAMSGEPRWPAPEAADPHIDWGIVADRLFTLLDQALPQLAPADVSPFRRALEKAVDSPHRFVLGLGQTADDVDPAFLEPVAYDGFGAPLYAHQVPPEGTE